jgi:hypothetical protein
MNPFVSFMASPAGRATRVAGGLALIIWGIWGLGGAVGVIVAIIGVVPLAAGAVDVCVFAPLFGNPFKGKEIRAG